MYSLCYSKCSLGLPALASSGILLEMQSLRPHLQFPESESLFNSIPRSCSCTLKLAKCCSKSGISKIGPWSKSGQMLVFIKIHTCFLISSCRYWRFCSQCCCPLGVRNTSNSSDSYGSSDGSLAGESFGRDRNSCT